MSTQEERAEQARAKLAQEVAQGLERTRENWPMLLEIFADQAKQRHAKYCAHIKAGFTEGQALHLCCVS